MIGRVFESHAATLARAVALVALAGCASPVIGAECRPGLTVCANQCVDLDSDPRHCGSCDRACDLGQACHLGVCVGAWDGAVGDAGAGNVDDPDASLDAGTTSPDASVSDGGAPTDGGGPTACELGELRCGDACVRPDSDPMNCGGCGVACAGDEVCSGGECAWVCDAPRLICDGLCVDPRRNPDHCGACGNRCPSGVCVAGACSGPVAGHLVLVGHDYRSSRYDMNRVAGNAVFLGRGNPVRVLVYEGDARAVSIDGVDAAVAQVAGATGRSWIRTAASTPDEVPLRLADADVFVLYAQTDADDTTLDDLGKAWGAALRTFLTTGGVVVVFDGMGTNTGTHRALRSAGLFDAAGRVDVSRGLLEVLAPADAVAVGLPLRYRGETSTVRFGTGAGVAVVGDRRGPVVLHHTVLP